MLMKTFYPFSASRQLFIMNIQDRSGKCIQDSLGVEQAGMSRCVHRLYLDFLSSQSKYVSIEYIIQVCLCLCDHYFSFKVGNRGVVFFFLNP